MAISAAFHRNVLLLTQVIQPNDDFKKLFREGMFDKPNTAGFLQVSRYLLTIYDSERFKKLVAWPVICKKTEAQYRNNVKDYLTIVATENPDICFPSILNSHLFHAGGSKFTIIMWKLSQVAVRTYITRETTYNVTCAPRAVAGGNVAELFLQNTNEKRKLAIQSHHANGSAMEAAVKAVLQKEIAIQAKTRTQIFETEQLIADLVSNAPVHPAIQKRLVDTNDANVIEMWKAHINKYINYSQNQNTVLKELEDLSSKVKEVVLNNSNDANILDGKQLKWIDSSMISEFFPPKDQCLLFQLYKNDTLVLYNFIMLFNSLLRQLLQRFKLYPPEDISKCLSQIEASCKDMDSILNCLHTFSANIAQTSAELEKVLSTERVIQVYNYNGLGISDNVLLIPSPLIKIDTNYKEEQNESQKRLQFTPVEAAHKSLFSRYERQDRGILREPKLRSNFLISRINFDEAISTVNEDKQSLNTHLSTPKRNASSVRHAGKYSRLFSTRGKRYNTTANSSIISMSCAKANSTAITNAIEDMHNASILGIEITTKNISITEKFVTPQKLPLEQNVKCETTSPQKLPINEIQSEDSTEIKDVVNALPSKINIPEIGETIDTNSNYDSSIVSIEQALPRRRSIGDLVQRYKRLVEYSRRKNSPINCSEQEV